MNSRIERPVTADFQLINNHSQTTMRDPVYRWIRQARWHSRMALCLTIAALILGWVYSTRGQGTNALLERTIPATELNPGLGSLPLMSEARTRSISPENPTGEKGKGAMMIPKLGDPEQPHANLFAHLGRGWKTRPFLTLGAGKTRTLMDVNGPGMIQHIWIVIDEDKWRSCVVRFYWDDETTPSIEAPLSDFFAIGHGKFAPVNSLPVLVNARSALNCFWPMPFRKHARITLSNEAKSDVGLLTYQITYAEASLPENAAYFHAQYRRAPTAQQNPYVILDGVRGRGQYVGTFLAWSQMTDEWFGEGEIKFYLDGDQEFPTICGTGTEDYFLSSYGFPRLYSTPYVGVTLKDGPVENDGSGKGGTKWSLYRWHVMDPIRFQQDLRVTIQALGWEKGKVVKKSDDIASVAFWYQSEPHAAFPALPPVAERIRDAHKQPPPLAAGAMAVEAETMKIISTSEGLHTSIQENYPFTQGEWSGSAQLFVTATKEGDFIELLVADRVIEPKKIILEATQAPDYGILRFLVNGQPAGAFDGYAETARLGGPVELGIFAPTEGKLTLRVQVTGANPQAREGKYYFGLDRIILAKP
jgi:hypothetical protein